MSQPKAPPARTYRIDLAQTDGTDCACGKPVAPAVIDLGEGCNDRRCWPCCAGLADVFRGRGHRVEFSDAARSAQARYWARWGAEMPWLQVVSRE